MRGIQATDASGVATFQTVYPGWYRGRTVHIHVKVHIGGSVVHSGQLFFNETVNAQVMALAPYRNNTWTRKKNSSDGIYNNQGGSS